ncbi:hypothetical protein GCM10023174_23630 [Chelativorans composti]|jgi:Uncharacterized conserved protein|uniref:PepSY domain-containing protein n=1 Tax=Chelativorans composti TaxID=768533 RepID=A0ABW5DDD9_9HYPH
MRTIAMTLALLMAGAAVPALADDDYACERPPVTSGQIVTTAELAKMLEDQGYRVQEIEVKGGCYEVKAVNESGNPIKAYYDQATGELLWARLTRARK